MFITVITMITIITFAIIILIIIYSISCSIIAIIIVIIIIIIISSCISIPLRGRVAVPLQLRRQRHEQRQPERADSVLIHATITHRISH